MTTYRVDIAPAASGHIEQAFLYIHERSPINAGNWLRKLYRRIDSLEKMPRRCGVIRENDAFNDEVRELLHFSHRIIFTIDEVNCIVKIHAFRHGARDELQGDEF